MKKFLSICLVALCSVSAMYAEGTIQDSRNGVSCGTEVKVDATSNDGYHHLKEWKIENGATVLETVAKNTTTPSTLYQATASASVDLSDHGKEKGYLKLTSLSSTLIDAATSGTVTFEAIFEIDSYKITSATEGSGSVSIDEGVDGDGKATGNTTVKLTANPDPCSKLVGWKVDGQTISGATGTTLTFTPEETWEHNSEHTITAVFETKTININVKSDTSMGTVSISAPTAPASAGN